jgi:hypothetical protein
MVEKVALGQVFPRVHRFSLVSFIPPVVHYTGRHKNRRRRRRRRHHHHHIIFTSGLYSKPQGCGVSKASATGPFTKENLTA